MVLNEHVLVPTATNGKGIFDMDSTFALALALVPFPLIALEFSLIDSVPLAKVVDHLAIVVVVLGGSYFGVEFTCTVF